MRLVTCSDLAEGKTVKLGDILIVGTKVIKDTQVSKGA